ncbi:MULTISPECIES: polysaccharide deacetylase family protein [Streptomyces]|uniref:polysaccharide deacetylase family protein n=1 Tax=Streptomyces TaxID=1883 RepID=UPI00051705D7|nr:MULTISPECIES: polysaccharide deacetylase family protein [Streptomyces]MDX2920200.1 polysaccharide deacetylase family protein [Streptomyces sp. NE06-03C]MDX3608530.1 polysaccharide deacetylase family protein [Streptomyces sp. FL06-04B]MDX3734558.1 polysaccharide deacetylase family protein [Streptomyces sp. ID01-15D]
MQLVRQKEKSAGKQHRSGVVVLAALLAAAVASGCAAETGGSGAGVPGGSAKPTGGRSGDAAPQPGPARAPDTYAETVRKKQAARAVAAKKWGLAKVPLAAPEPPKAKPPLTTRKGFEVRNDEGLPPVFTTVPTKEKIVFLTMDDGAEKDPELLRMMTELSIPYSAFVSDYVINDDYGYFKKMQRRGVTISNHTLNHRYLPGLSYAEQKREICGQQEKILKHYGKRPTLFRPPYGNYNRDTLVVAKSCGITAVPLWSSEAFPDRMEWREWDRDLHPGDIVLTHFRGEEDWKGSMPDMVRRVMKTITDKGYAVAKLEDYV